MTGEESRDLGSLAERMRRYAGMRGGALLWFGGAALGVGAFLKLSQELFEDATIESLDARILIEVASRRTALLDGMAVDITALGSFTLITLFTIIGVAMLALAKDGTGALHLATGSIGAALWSTLAKGVFERARPDIVEQNGTSKEQGWPENRWLRQGVRANGWVLLQRVPLWFEIWRQLNGFPPVVADGEPDKFRGTLGR
mgnify:CR=1 FL=1